MAPRLITSSPRPSIRHHGWFYSYYNAKTARGTDCVAVFPKSLVSVIKPGFTFDDETHLQWDEQLGASVLTVDFHTPPEGSPSLPPNQAAGWRDPDGVLTELAEPEALKATATRLGVIPEPPKLDHALEELLEQACMAFTYACRRIGVAEKPRAMEAQKIAVTCMIPWLKAKGVTLSDEEEKAMSF